MDSDELEKDDGLAERPVEIYTGHRSRRVDLVKKAEIEAAWALEEARQHLEWHKWDAPRFLVEVAGPIKSDDWDDNYRFCQTTISAEIVRVVDGERFRESFYTSDQANVTAWKNGARFVWASRREIQNGAIVYAGRGSASHPFEVEFDEPEDVVRPREWCEPRAFELQLFAA